MQGVVIGYLIVFFLFIYFSQKKYIVAFFTRNQKFKCKRCGHCCRLKVGLNKDDIKRIKSKGHADFVKWEKNKTFIKRINKYCPFLNLHNGTAKCGIYNYRPEICQTFPRKTKYKIKFSDPRCSAFQIPKVFRYF